MTTSKRNKHRKKPRIYLYSNGLWLFQLCLALLLCSAAYVIWLDHRIRTEFEGKRWSLPARVYARPLELYAGLHISPAVLGNELRALGYRETNSPAQPGEYKMLPDKILLFSRNFQFWDGREPARKCILFFDTDTLVALTGAGTDTPIPVLRLEPQLIGKIYSDLHEDRVLVAFNDVPPVLIDTLISVEDRSFFKHHGIDPRGILRAMWNNLRSADVTQGGSTITQQLVKNFFLTHERTLWRKINEIIMALLLEMHYSKMNILAAYINEIYLGQRGALGVHGFGTAAEFYYARPLGELRIDQIATLVALVRGASYYNPRKYPARALARRNLVIQQMLEQGYLDKSSAEQAQSKPLDISARPGWSNAKYPAFLDLVKQQLQIDYQPEDLRNEGLRIFTTLNPAYQDMVEQATSTRLAAIEKLRNIVPGTLETAGIISHTETGEILAIFAGRDRNKIGFNRAIYARRLVGSLLKPVIYLSALSEPQHYNVLTMLQDTPVQMKQIDGSFWTPENYDSVVHGSVTLHEALEKSYNLATIRLGMDLGMQRIEKTLKQLGVNEDLPDYPSVYLGAIELSPLQVAQLYQTLAGNGFQVPLRAIRDVLDKNGKPLQRYALDIQQSVDNRAVFITNFLLTQVAEQGTARSVSARLPALMPLAGKTGTTNDLRDSWFAGFGDNILGVVWIGRDDNKPAGLTGATGALQVWIDIMQALHPQPLSLTAPEGVQWVRVYGDYAVDGNCPGSGAFPFIEPYLPVLHPCPGTGSGRSDDKTWKIFDIFR